MSSTTRMVVLGAVRMFQPAHGYQVRQALLSMQMNEWANVAPGSVYHALKTMARDGLLRVVDADTDSGNVARTVYEITPSGDAEYRTLLRRAWLRVDPSLNALLAAVCFLPDLPKDELIGTLRHRITQLEANHLVTRSGSDLVGGVAGRPRHVVELFELTDGISNAELEWTRRLLAKLEAGEYGSWQDVIGEGQPG